MGNIKLGNLEVPLGSILVFVGAVVALISLFLGYVNMEMLVNPITDTWEKITISGTDLISGSINDYETDDLSFVRWMPLLVVIFAIVGLVLAIIPMFAKLSVDKKIYNIIVAVIMALAVVFAIVFVAMGGGAGLFTGTSADLIESYLENDVFKMPLGVGAYLGLIGAIVGLVGAGLNVKENL